ncbi:MAG TPA: glycoside-pentoside-hexuronide (GPH):cation symporter [Candidatus Dorea gallistercoris]|uniref:Glycoside-pentoside-hexuronide (GPH):cation symporter n=1 Tax=Candidatus Dorea gallistercoris TaxID=2838542 RepID=A0A9D1UFA7_9FIRM|nr:glycoside-pentoside-hexuronide (GPH):cation symporter [Candidatus Dorea gallistercoris]
MEEKRKSIYTVTTVRYGMTNFFSSLVTTMASTYFAVYLTGAVGLSAAAVGSIITIAGIADTISVPCVGVAIQSARFKKGKFRPWLLYGGAACAIFSVMRFLNLGGKNAVYYGLMYVLCYVAFNFAYSAYTGIMPILAKDPTERVNLAACRIQFNSLSKFVLGLVSVQVIAFFSESGEADTRGYGVFAAILGVLVFVGFYQLYRLAADFDKPIGDGERKETKEKVSILDMIRSIISVPMVLYLIAAVLKIGTFFSVNSIAAYYYDYVIGSRQFLTLFLSGSTLLMIGGAFITPFIAKAIGGARNVFIAGGIVYGGAMLVSWFARSSAIVFTLLMCVGYVGYAMMHSSEAAVYSTIVDYTEYKTGKDLKGFLMSIFTLSPKLGAVIQGTILGVGLTAIGFNADHVTESAINGIPVLMSLLPAILLAVTVTCMIIFPLSDKKVKKMQEEIEKNKDSKNIDK